MGHELEHIQDEVDIFNNVMTPDRILRECSLLKIFFTEDSSGLPKRISPAERDAYFRPTIPWKQGNELIGHFSRVEKQIFDMWQKEADTKAAFLDNAIAIMPFGSNVGYADSGNFAAIRWPVSGGGM